MSAKFYPINTSPPEKLELDIRPRLSSQQSAQISVASLVVKILQEMGVSYAFGISGGAMRRCGLRCSIARSRFTTTGPGITNACVFRSGALFDYATILECSEQLPEISRRLALGLAHQVVRSPSKYPHCLQTSSSFLIFPLVTFSQTVATVSEETNHA